MGPITDMGHVVRRSIYFRIRVYTARFSGPDIRKERTLRSGIFTIAGAGLILLLSMRIDIYNMSSYTKTGSCDEAFYLRLLGETKSMFSYLSILQADLYYHGGVGHFYSEHKGEMGLGHEEGACQEEHHHAQTDMERYSGHNILMKIDDAIRVNRHVHLEGDQTKEVVPWLYYSLKMDPNNVMAYTLSSYWLAYRMKRFDEGMSCLQEGLINNPHSWEIKVEIGRLYLEHYKKYSSAKTILGQAISDMNASKLDNFQQRYVYSLYASSCEMCGDEEGALKAYSHVSELFPEDSRIRDKIEQIGKKESENI